MSEESGEDMSESVRWEYRMGQPFLRQLILIFLENIGVEVSSARSFFFGHDQPPTPSIAHPKMPTRTMRSIIGSACISSILLRLTWGWTATSLSPRLQTRRLTQEWVLAMQPGQEIETDPMATSCTRRDAILGAALMGSGILLPNPSQAADSVSSAEITDRIYINVKGIADEPQRVVIGLFGKEAPSSVAKLKKLVTREGLLAPCRPRAERSLTKEQLEANKVYNSCLEGEEEGVSLQYSQIWRVIRNERIDVGAVTGKFVAREYPDWQDPVSSLKHDTPGVVSVRRGNDGGFGFTIYPGDGSAPNILNEDNIIVGQVVEGMDVVRALNEVPVVKSSTVNYMALTGGTTTKNAPTRACRYGGPMYCNENKPLIKLSITQAGVL